MVLYCWIMDSQQTSRVSYLANIPPINSTDQMSLNVVMGNYQINIHRGSDTRPTGPPKRYPIVFIHGNSDIGMGNGGSVGW